MLEKMKNNESTQMPTLVVIACTSCNLHECVMEITNQWQRTWGGGGGGGGGLSPSTSDSNKYSFHEII